VAGVGWGGPGRFRGNAVAVAVAVAVVEWGGPGRFRGNAVAVAVAGVGWGRPGAFPRGWVVSRSRTFQCATFPAYLTDTASCRARRERTTTNQEMR
jgi:hypothetical protein